jgi:hypothetical protein
VTILALGSFFVYPVKEAFSVLPWNAWLSANPASAKGSKDINLAWGIAYGDMCTPVRLMLRYDKSGTPPDPEDPKAGDLLRFLDTDETSTTHGLLHAATTYSYTIYGCEDSGCDIICDDVGHVSDSALTETEKWLATSIHGYDEDTDVRILDPTDWTEQAGPDMHRHTFGTYDDQAAVFFLADDATPELPHAVYVMHSDDTTWQSDWNTADWGIPVMIASGTGAGDYMNPKNIIVVPSVDEADNERLALFVTTTDHKDSPTFTNLISAEALDADGDDFGLCCTDSEECSTTDDCNIGDYDQVCCNFEDTGAKVRLEFEGLVDNCLDLIGWHGHDLWDDMGPAWDPDDDELTILFTGDQNSEEPCENCAPEDGSSNIDMWRWDTGGGCDTGDPDTAAKFCLEEVLEYEGEGQDWCPDEKFEDRHDPFSVSYIDEKKVYWKEGMETWYVAYTSDNGRTFADISEIEFYFDDTDAGFGLGDELFGGCVEDPASIIWKDGTTVHELMVIVPGLDPVDNENFRCFSTQNMEIDTDDPEYETYPGLFTAILTNG